MINPFFFTDRSLKLGFDIKLDSHHNNHTNSKLNIKPKKKKIGIEIRYFNEILKKMATIFGKFLNQNKYKYQTVFSARFDEKNEANEMLDELESFINLNKNQKLTERGVIHTNDRYPLDHQMQNQVMNDGEWRFDEINSMTI